MIRYHYVLTVQYHDHTGVMNVQSYDGDAHFNPDQGEQARYDEICARTKERLDIPGEPAILFYRCVPDSAAEVIQAIAKAV